MYDQKFRHNIGFKLIIFIVTIFSMSLAGCNHTRQYISLFKNESDLFALQSDGAVYHLDNGMNKKKPVEKLPVNRGVSAFFQKEYYYYVDGRNLISYSLSDKTSKVLCVVKSGDYADIEMVMGNHVIFKTSQKVNGSFGQYAYFDFNLQTSKTTPMTGDFFPSDHVLNFLAAYDTKVFFTDQNKIKLAEIDLDDMAVTDLSSQLEFTPVKACISNDTLYLCAWHEALYHMSLDSEPVVQQVKLNTPGRNPGAMAAYDTGVLISMDDKELNSVIYYLSGEDLSLKQVSDSRFKAWNVWYIMGIDDRFYCIDSDGQGIKTGLMTDK